jgi:hypothetical protein
VTLEEFLGRLDGVRAMAPGKRAARCPAHEDRVGSLVVSDGDDRVLMHCHAGCSVAQIMECLGLDQRDLFYVPRGAVGSDGSVNLSSVQPSRVPLPAGPAGGTSPARLDIPLHIVEAWEAMLTARPDVVARVLEVKGWSVRALRACRVGWDSTRLTFPVFEPEQRWLVGLVRYLPGGEPKSYAVGARELWPAPESLTAGDVWLVEGEPDRVSAVELGLNATALPGVGTWKPGWAERFRGRRVTVCLDCDDVGRETALARVRGFAAAGVDARSVDLFPGRSDGYDLSDALVGAVGEGRVDDLRRYLLRLEFEAWEQAA